jgi:hypothetical protein
MQVLQSKAIIHAGVGNIRRGPDLSPADPERHDTNINSRQSRGQVSRRSIEAGDIEDRRWWALRSFSSQKEKVLACQDNCQGPDW